MFPPSPNIGAHLGRNFRVLLFHAGAPMPARIFKGAFYSGIVGVKLEKLGAALGADFRRIERRDGFAKVGDDFIVKRF